MTILPVPVMQRPGVTPIPITIFNLMTRMAKNPLPYILLVKSKIMQEESINEENLAPPRKQAMTNMRIRMMVTFLWVKKLILILLI
ncbi:MAG: hypothetical protein HN888_03725 [Desulfobacula sp.]|nr:hypothetical protein [Desulfobacula sp.]